MPSSTAPGPARPRGCSRPGWGPARAEPIFREAIATWHQGRRDEARSWFASADRFVLERLPGGSIGREYRPPSDVSAGDWWCLLIARREAQGLILDADFPADPFAH